MAIEDSSGATVYTFNPQGRSGSPPYTLSWDGTNSRGHIVAPGRLSLIHIFRPGADDLPVRATEGEDVVGDEVVPAIVLMEPAGLRSVHQVVVRDHVRGALIEVDPPATVAEGLDVVHVVVMEARARRDAQSVDAPHVAQDALADGVHVVIGDLVVVRRAVRIPP